MPFPIRVGIADDDPIIGITLRAALKKVTTVQVVAVVEDGAAAVQLAQSGAIDLLVLDMEMPAMTGPQALARIRAASPSVRVVILSSLPASMKAAEMEAAGACAYLEKPCNVPRLVQIIEAVW
jgi:two-component system, NarL family, invasion response regulator UvrY